MSYETITYREIVAKAERTGPCTICEKPTRRTMTFGATVSPFNKIDDPAEPDGRRPKTPAEVRADVRAQAEAWAPEPALFDHERCRAERDHPADDSPVPPEPRDEQLTERTHRLLAAMAALGAFIAEHGLAASSADIRPAGWGTRPETDIDIRPATPAEFLRWCAALGVEEVQLDCERDQTYLRVTAPLPALELIRVRMWRAIPRGPLGERLPGVEWEWPRNDLGRKLKAPKVPLEHVRTALRRLRVPDQVADQA